MIKVLVTIEGRDIVRKGSKYFGYDVINNVPGCRGADYQNRAKLIGNQYLLEEKHWPRSPYPFDEIAVVRGHKIADKILYEKAKQVAKKALEGISLELIDRTNIFSREQKKIKRSKKW